MAITRTADTDDDGTGTTGRVRDAAWKTEFYNQIDAAPAVQTVLAARTDTGAVNNWAPAISGNTYIPWNGAADATFSGLAGGVAGQIAWVENITAAKVAYFLHASGLSSAANQFTNYATSGATPIGPGGKLAYFHNGTNWRLIFHEQGAWITPTFAAGSYTANAGTWTLQSGDVIYNEFRLSGRTLSWNFRLATTSVSNAGAVLQAAIPGGFTAATSSLPLTRSNDNATAFAVSYMLVNAAAALVQFVSTIGGTGYAIATNTTEVAAAVSFEVT